MVSLFLHVAARTTVRPVGQGHPLPMAAGGTGLGRIGQIDLHKLPTGSVPFTGRRQLIPERASHIVQINEIRAISQESEGHAYIPVLKDEILRRFFDKTKLDGEVMTSGF